MTDVAGLKQAHGKQIWGMSKVFHDMFEWMFRAGTIWQLDESGKVTNVLMTEAFGQAMELQHKLWEVGAIHPDAIGGDLPDMFSPGQVALTVDSFSGFFTNMLPKLADSTPESEPEFFVPPAFDGGDITIQRDNYWGIVAISAEAAKDEDRLHELLNIINYWRRCQGVEATWGSPASSRANASVGVR
ncbi:hypothetical protein ACIGH6_16565 [Brachybacterium paraconglomeratum]|uniref:hypothetical protein n=1 Tax=Brachybacterium paraconglomeratum TaxID=173362 RepID=UPI0037C6753A